MENRTRVKPMSHYSDFPLWLAFSGVTADLSHFAGKMSYLAGNMSHFHGEYVPLSGEYVPFRQRLWLGIAEIPRRKTI